jgi:hypothetical protein
MDYLVKGVLVSWFASTLCLEVMTMFMLISDILCVCMLLICRLCFITPTIMFMREGDQVKT